MVDRFTDKGQMLKMIDDSLGQIEADPNMDPAWKTPLQTFLPAVRTFFVDAPAGGTQAGSTSTASSQANFFGDFVKTIEITRNKGGPKTTYDITFPQGIIWGLLSCAAGFGITMVSERTGGTLVRLRMGPLSARHILAGKAMACFITCISISTLLFVFGRLVFNVRPDSVLLLAVAIVCSAICFVGIMMFIAVLGRTEQAAGSIGWGVLSIMAMIGGGMVPLMFMPSFVQTLGHISPIKWSIYAMEGAIWRGFSPAEMVFPCLMLLAFGVGCFAIGTRWFRWTEEG
jgi:ABC-2 type transport system permease protein